MKFDEKLDFLMNITRTTNSALALYTSLDASHISRLRRGERKLPKNENYVKAMASYFSRHCGDDYQQKALLEALDKSAIFPEDQEKISELLYEWLLDGKASENAAVEGFLHGISHFQFKKRQPPEQSNLLTEPQLKDKEVSILYGVDGKRDAVLAFLSLVLKTGRSQTLHLFSDEDMEWLTGDPIFTARWADLLSQVIMQGNRIKIIHTVSRNLDEMLEALGKWIPLYMTGAIEPYYYPKKRDGIFQRTLFIAPKTAAVVSTSVGNMAEKAANFLLTGQRALEAITEEFNSYLQLCKPLMQIFAPSDRLGYLKTLHEFEKESADAIIKTVSLSLYTMPMEVAESIIARTKNNQLKELLNYLKKRQEVFKHSLRENRFTEIINWSLVSITRETRVGIGFSGMLGAEDCCYTPNELRLHLENIVSILETYLNYNVCIENDVQPEGYMLYVKEDLGAIVVKTLNPYAIFAINESNMTAAFWDFMKGKTDRCIMNKKKVIASLQKVIDELNV